MADSVTEILLRARGDFSDLTGKISGLRKEFQNLKLPKDITANLEKGFNRLDPILKSYQKQLDKGFKTKTDLKNFEATRHELDAIFGDITSEIQKVNGQPVQLKADLKEITALEKKLDGFGEKLQTALDKITIKEGGKVTNEINKLVAATSKASTIKPMTIKAQDLFNQQDFVAFNNEIDKIQNKILNLSNIRGAKVDLAKAIMGPNFTNDVEAMDGAIKRFFNDLKVSEKSMTGLAEINNNITKTGQALNQVKTDSLTRGVQALSDFKIGAQQASQQAKGLGDSIDGAASSSVRMADELQQLKTSTQYFFSLRNMINLFKRGVSEAVDVIKELDAAMTETAVVTDFSVGDMWKKLPEYTANANALGASVKDMYEATTLYYQQGLETDAAMGIANETMKMARIGGLDAADATDKMTAALRGFNMVLDETSAQRVNDVYSNLAAKTASDTEELGTAMQRTASIAASAGMSFEGTAAFLAQAIETTREPAENLGTAMKTIVARFTELKKNPLEISEVDGEEVDYNKVDTALKSIGVSLKDANGQFRNLDQVFLDIAQRWDGLTQTQQRYVATQAAGSRQQSRFIAMMSNYERTVELMDYANNSAGASNEQFGKTMESLEAKLNKLKNAWNEFLMGIMNDSMTKFVVDAGTKLLGLLNDITDVLSFGGQSGLLKSITSLTAAFIGLKTAGKLINFGVDKAGSLLNPNTPLLGFGGSHGEKVSKTTTTIVNPIVAEIRQVVAAIKGQSVVKAEYDKIGTVQQYKDSQDRLRTLLGLNDKKLIGGAKIDPQKNIKYSEVIDNLKGLSGDQQRQLLGTLPGLQQAMRGATLDLLKNNGVSKNSQKVGQQITKDIIRGMNKGAISVEKGIDLLRNPQKWGQIFGNKFNTGNLQEIANSVTSPEFNKLVEEAQDKYAQAIYRGQNADRTWLTDEEIAAKQADFEKYARRKSKDKAPIEDIDYTKYSQLGDKIGQVGANFAVAGQSVQQFGITLSNLGLEKAGALLMQLGSTISSLGMTFNGLGMVLPKIQERFADAGVAAAKAFKTAGKGVGGVASGGGAFFSTLFGSGAAAAAAGIGVAIVAATAIQKYLEQKAKEAGEEVRKQFEEKFTKANEKIESLEGYESRFNELAKGVDQFGHNISLTSEEYSEYLNISRELQQLSPSLIAGYNAEGEAIIKKGAAIQDVINKLKEEKQAELELFTSNTSIDKLIGEYKTSNAYKEYNWSERGHVTRGFDEEKTKISRLKDSDLDFKIVDAINQLSGWSLDSLNNLTTAQLSWLSKHYNDVINLVEEQNGTLEDEVREGYVDAFTNAGSAINDVMTEGKPIIDAMQMWMGDQKLDAIGLGLGEEFSNSFNQGVEGIMLTGLTEGWDSDKFKDNLKNYSNEWKVLGGETSKYSEILSKAKEEQENYLDSIGTEGAIEDYQHNVEGLATQLESLAEQYRGTGAAGEAFAEQCIQQAGALRNYATEGAMSLGEALNVLSNNFAEARGAKERFDKAIEGGDYYTAAEGYRSIAETVLDVKNATGDGSIAGWAGAEELLGRDFVDNNSWKDIKKRVQEVNSLFDDGIEGVYNFNDMLVNAWNNGKIQDMGKVVDGAFEFDFDNVENIKEWAKELEISEGVLSAMIDKSRQFAAFNVGNNKEIRHALEQSNQAMIGQSRKGGKSALYTSESAFREQARQQGIHGDDYAKTKRDLTKEQNVKFLTVDSLTSKDKNGFFKLDKVLADVGLTGRNKTLDGAVAALTQMGFSLEEQQRILTADGIKLADGEASDKEIEQAYQEHAYASENPTVAGIAGDTGVIATAATAMLAQMGIMTDQMKQDIQDATSNPTIEGYKNSLNPEGGFKDTASRDAARAEVKAQLADYQATMDILKQGGLEDTAEYQSLQRASQELTQALNEEEASWTAANQKIVENLPVLEKITDENDKQYLESHATDVQTALHAENVDTGIAALQQLQEQGNLSVETMDQLANAFIALHATDLSVMDDAAFAKAMNDLGIYGSEVEALRQSFQKPFTIQTQLTGEDLKEYVANIDGLTEKERSIILKSYVNNADKVTDLLNEINNEFGDGTEETKSIIVQATAKLATGDAKGAHDLLQEQFGDDAETIETQLNIICDGSIANPNEVKSALEGEIEGLKPDAQVKVSADVSKINGSVSVDTKSIESARESAAAGAEMPIYAEASSFETKVKALQQTGKKTINISPNFTGTWRHDLIITKTERKRGQNYSIPAHQSLSFGAAANGLNLPKKKRSSGQQMTALVGEEGFEVGYIPSESRSMILGANGPEITSFPKETVIYPHKQSKEIVRKGKKDHKIMGSFVSGLLPSRPSGGGNGGSTYSAKHSSNKQGGSSSTNQKKNYNNWSIEEVIRFDIDQNLERLASDLKNITNNIDSNLEKIGTTANKISDVLQDQNQNLKDTLKYNEDLRDSYQRELDSLLNATSANYKVSYTLANGKSTNKLINPADYIFKNAAGTYEVDTDAINKLQAGKTANANSDRALRESVFNEVSKALNELQSGIVKTTDTITDLQKQIKENAEKVSEALYQWENELTEVYDLSQRIADETSLTDRFASQIQLELSKLNVGFGQTEQSINNIRNTLTRNNLTIQEQIKNQQQMIAARQRELNAALSAADEWNKVEQYQNDTIFATDEIKTETIAWATAQAENAEQALKYVTNIFKDLDGSVQYDIDWEQFNKDNEANQFTNTTYEAIKKYLDDLNDKATAFNESIKDQTDFIKQTYDALKEYQDYVVDVEDTLIKGTEEQIQKAQDNAKKISDSVTNALKDLLDEVKRKLDERREQEDNAKTEQDISQKQQRLAALRADTAGGHQVEIAQLEKEIADAQQSYQRTLEDQLLDRLSQQADEASKQRERQIELAEISNTLSSENNKAEVNMWLRNPTQFKEEIKAAYLEANEYDDKGEAGQATLLNSFESWFANLVTAVEQSGFNSENGIFKPFNDGAETAVNLADKMTNLIGREDELTLATTALEDATKRNTESILTLIAQGASVADLKQVGVSAEALTQLNYTLEQLIGADSKNPIYSASELHQAGFTANELKQQGFDIEQLIAGEYNAPELKAAGYGVSDLKEQNFTIEQLKDIFDLKELTSVFGISDLRQFFGLDKLKTVFDAADFGKSNVSYQDARTVFSAEELQKVSEYAELATAELTTPKNPYGTTSEIVDPITKKSPANDIKSLQWSLKELGFYVGTGTTIDGKWGNLTDTAVADFEKMLYGHVGNRVVGPQDKAELKIRGYKTGGLADYTGPAWLDGTPSKPELVLNAKDTQNFLALRDVLGSAMKTTGAINNSYGGDTTYEININVDHLNSDYDVDKVAERVKKIIVKDSGYRNVTQVRNFR